MSNKLEQLESRRLLSSTTGFVHETSGGGAAVDRYLSGITVYTDADRDGQFDAGTEPSTVTDANGRFVLPYRATHRDIRAVLPEGFVQLGYFDGNTIQVAQPVAGVRGVAYDDANQNGVRDPGERPLPELRVMVDLPDATAVEGWTAPDGSYFIPLPAGTYTVRCTYQTPVYGLAPTDLTSQGLVIATTPDSGTVLVSAGAVATGPDFGMVTRGNVRVFVHGPRQGTYSAFIDTNGNGVLDAGEPQQSDTGPGGAFWFRSLPAGDYTIRVIANDPAVTLGPTLALDNRGVTWVPAAAPVTGKVVTYTESLNETTLSFYSAVNLVTLPHAQNDFNGDGISDYVRQEYGKVVIQTLWQRGPLWSHSIEHPDGSFRYVASGDFDGDGDPDLLFRHHKDGRMLVWRMEGVTKVEEYALPTIPDANWKVFGAGDFNGDGTSDIYWRHGTTGLATVWRMQAGTHAGYLPQAFVANLDWEVQTVNDFDQDGRPDLLWRNRADGRLSYWFMQPDGKPKFRGGAKMRNPTQFNLTAVIDRDCDGRLDLWWGGEYLWRMGPDFVRPQTITPMVSILSGA